MVFGALFGAGVHTDRPWRDVIRLFGGTLVLTNAAIYLLVATGFEEDSVRRSCGGPARKASPTRWPRRSR